MYRFTPSGFAEFTITRQQSTYATTTLCLDNFIWRDLSALYCSIQKWVFSIFKLGIGRGSTWKLPGTFLDWMTQSLAEFYTLLQVDVHQSQSQTSQLPSFWNALIMWTFRQFLLKYPAGVLVLGQTTSPIRELEKERGCWEKRHAKIPLPLVTNTNVVFDHYNYNYPDLKKFC